MGGVTRWAICWQISGLELSKMCIFSLWYNRWQLSVFVKAFTLFNDLC